MSFEPANEFEWNAGRKFWHLTGCFLMLFIFYQWRGLDRSLFNATLLVCFVWMETGILIAIDIMRFYSPRQTEVLKGLPFYGKLMRPVEENHFNATTYYLLAAAILTTAYEVGWCRVSTLVVSLAVLGVADPAAALTRYLFQKYRLGYERAAGLLAFLASSILVMWAVSRLLDTRLNLQSILCIAGIVALIENYTKHLVAFIRPLTAQVQRRITHPAAQWLTWLYPDDNLAIPLAVAILAGLLPAIL